MYLLLFFFQAEDGIRDLIVTGVQTCDVCAPRASWPATGANTSRAWKVGAASTGIGSPTKCASAGRNDSRPLSGATKKCPAVDAASTRRSVPTPGSTTARCTLPCGNRCQTRDRIYCAARTSPGG